MIGAIATFLRQLRRTNQRLKKLRPTPPLRAEELEPRVTPTALHVTTSADDGPGSLRAQVAAAVTGDTIDFTISGATINLRSQITCTQSITIDGGNQNITINAGNNSRVFDFTAAGAVSETVRNLKFTGGAAGAGSSYGGVISVRGGITLADDWFRNSSAGYGGAVAIDSVSSDDTVSITGCHFISDSATVGGGGAIAIWTGTSSPSITLDRDEFDTNSANSGGGAVGAWRSRVAPIPTTTLTVTNSTFTTNTAGGDGGAIATNCQLSVSSTTARSFFDNNGAGKQGGAIFSSGSQLTVTGVAFDVNTAIRGGAVYASGGNETIVACLFNNNRANAAVGDSGLTNDGGGIYVTNATAGSASAALTITNSTFYNNLASNNGAGIAILNTNTGTGANTVTMTSLTMAANAAGNLGGGIWTSTPADPSLPTLRNNIIAGNTGTNGGNDVSGTIFSANKNMLGTQAGSTGWNATDFTTANAMLTALARNGGWTMTMAVPAVSPAYRAGDATLLTAADPLSKDQRGYTRNGTSVTIGAYDPDTNRGAAANNAPSGTNNTVSAPENGDYVFALGDFGFSDSSDSPPDDFFAVEITTVPAAGSLQDNGTTVSAGDFVSATDIASGALAFTPGTNASGRPYTSFTFQVQDDGGTANGGVDTDPSANTMTINVAPTATLTVTDASGPYTGSPFTATALVAGTVVGVDDTPSASLESVTPTLVYYSGTETSGTPLSGAPTNPGTYTVITSFAGSTDYSSASAETTFQIEPTVTGVVINQDISALYNAAGQPAAGVQRSMVDDVVYTFSTPVNITSSASDPNVFTVAVASGWTGTVPTLNWAAVAGSGGTQWAVSFSGSGVTGGSIANGCYTITISDPSAITAVADGQGVSLASSGIGGATQSFFRLYGDINADKFVNGADNIKFNQALTTYNAAFDFNADGYVNSTDTTQFDDDLTLNYSGFTTTI